MNFFQSYCFDCGRGKISHIESWIDDLLNFLPGIPLLNSKKLNNILDFFIENCFKILKLARYQKIDNLQKINISLGSKIFLEEIKKEGGGIFILKSIFGYTRNFLIKYNNKKIKFFGLPTAEFLNPKIHLIDDKIYVKKKLIKNNFPAPQGKTFWFWEKNKAIKYAYSLDWPLVVKPRSGSLARHITLNILNEKQLKIAIDKAIEYSPTFIIEKFIEGSVFRATVIDFKKVFCVKQIPANVVGNGISSIDELIKIKNSDSKRGNPHDKNYVLYKILINETSKLLLTKQGYTFESIPKKGEIVYLQQAPFLRLGGDLIEITKFIHPDNKKLFCDISRLFNVRLTGIDFIAQDISKSWKNQKCGVLELNTLPFIELHVYPTFGKPQNIAKELINLIKKYY